MIRAHKAVPQYFGQDERTLWNMLKADKCTPNPSDNRLRLKFWNEYERAQESMEWMVVVHIYSGICSREYFFQKYMIEPYKMAWLLCPPANYLVITEEALQVGLEALRDILEQKLTLPNGRINVALGNLKLKIVELLDIRVKGAVVQKTMNLHVSEKKVADIKEIKSMEELDRRLRDIENRRRKNQGFIEMGSVTAGEGDPAPGGRDSNEVGSAVGSEALGHESGGSA